MGRHSFKFGGEIFHVQYNRFESPSVLGDFQFTSGFTTRTARNDGTGDPLASFLLGLPAIASRAVGPSRIDGRQWSYSLYAQDDFNLTPKLTINLGLRYELSPPMYDKNQQMSSIDYRNVPSPGAVFRRRENRLLQADDVHLRPKRHSARMCAIRTVTTLRRESASFGRWMTRRLFVPASACFTQAMT